MKRKVIFEYSKVRESRRKMTGTNHKVALITGASQGLGLALAEQLVKDGWRLIIDARGEAALAAAYQKLAPFGKVQAIPGDVTDPAHRQELAVTAARRGGLDLPVNNAGMLGSSPQPESLGYPREGF